MSLSSSPPRYPRHPLSGKCRRCPGKPRGEDKVPCVGWVDYDKPERSKGSSTPGNKGRLRWPCTCGGHHAEYEDDGPTQEYMKACLAADEEGEPRPPAPYLSLPQPSFSSSTAGPTQPTSSAAASSSQPRYVQAAIPQAASQRRAPRGGSINDQSRPCPTLGCSGIMHTKCTLQTCVKCCKAYYGGLIGTPGYNGAMCAEYHHRKSYEQPKNAPISRTTISDPFPLHTPPSPPLPSSMSFYTQSEPGSSTQASTSRTPQNREPSSSSYIAPPPRYGVPLPHSHHAAAMTAPRPTRAVRVITSRTITIKLFMKDDTPFITDFPHDSPTFSLSSAPPSVASILKLSDPTSPRLIEAYDASNDDWRFRDGSYEFPIIGDTTILCRERGYNNSAELQGHIGRLRDHGPDEASARLRSRKRPRQDDATSSLPSTSASKRPRHHALSTPDSDSEVELLHHPADLLYRPPPHQRQARAASPPAITSLTEAEAMAPPLNQAATDWPKHACDIILAVRNHRRNMRKNKNLTHKQGILDQFPLLPGPASKVNTWLKKRKYVHNAPKALKIRYLLAGRTREGLWRNFMRDVDGFPVRDSDDEDSMDQDDSSEEEEDDSDHEVRRRAKGKGKAKAKATETDSDDDGEDIGLSEAEAPKDKGKGKARTVQTDSDDEAGDEHPQSTPYRVKDEPVSPIRVSSCPDIIDLCSP